MTKTTRTSDTCSVEVVRLQTTAWFQSWKVFNIFTVECDGCCRFLVDALFYFKAVPSISSGPNFCFSVLFSSWMGVDFCQIAF